jgi:uncharacterized protein HemY
VACYRVTFTLLLLILPLILLLLLLLLLRRMKLTGHVARMGERKCVRKVLVGKPDGIDHLEDPVVDGG